MNASSECGRASKAWPRPGAPVRRAASRGRACTLRRAGWRLPASAAQDGHHARQRVSRTAATQQADAARAPSTAVVASTRVWPARSTRRDEDRHGAAHGQAAGSRGQCPPPRSCSRSARISRIRRQHVHPVGQPPDGRADDRAGASARGAEVAMSAAQRPANRLPRRAGRRDRKGQDLSALRVRGGQGEDPRVRVRGRARTTPSTSSATPQARRASATCRRRRCSRSSTRPARWARPSSTPRWASTSPMMVHGGTGVRLGRAGLLGRHDHHRRAR